MIFKVFSTCFMKLSNLCESLASNQLFRVCIKPTNVMFCTALFLPSLLARTMFTKHWRLFIDLKQGMLSSEQSFQDLEMSDSLGSVLTAELLCGLRRSHRLHEDTVSQARRAIRGNHLSRESIRLASVCLSLVSPSTMKVKSAHHSEYNRLRCSWHLHYLSTRCRAPASSVRFEDVVGR